MSSREYILKKGFYRSGFNNFVSFTTAFRGPLNYRYDGWRGILYKVYSIIIDLWTFIAAAGLIIEFVTPGIPLISRCLSGFTAMICFMTMFKWVYYYMNRTSFENLLIEYESCFPNDEFKEQLDEEIAKYSKMFRPVVIYMTIAIILTQMPWCFIPFVNEFRGKKPRVIAVPANFLFDPTVNSYSFLAICLLQTFAAYLIPVKNLAFDDVFYCYSSRQLALFSHLEKSLDRLLERHYSINGVDRPPGRKAELDFINWVKYHQKTITLMEDLQKLFSPVLLLYFGLISLSMCMNVFVVSLGELDFVQRSFCGIFAGGNILGLLFTCRVGDLIIYKSSTLPNAFLNKLTAIATKREHRILKLILTRIQVPSTMSAIGVFFLNSDTFQSTDMGLREQMVFKNDEACTQTQMDI
ncbi:hypothetical protein O3M35_010758 [Rhynocoris fuscipes]|uniref:Odorant receptor n=1 Tax=Rhynocoris fuscipes TaxID=488301 RepID=A0AAW1D0G1_9HEMI